jgi:tRNA-splicing ligase RtcB
VVPSALLVEADGAPGGYRMKSDDLERLGIPQGEPMRLAFAWIRARNAEGLDRAAIERRLTQVAADPSAHLADAGLGELAAALANAGFRPRREPAPWKQWGSGLEPESVAQMRTACELPVAVAGALMPDAHLGYGLPIGGVLATENAVIPYAVGVDIACRMKLSVLDLPVSSLRDRSEALARALETETRFGMGAVFEHKRQHDVLDEDWGVSPITRKNKDRAWAQLGTSGSGNHFVEFGVLTVDGDELGLPRGEYLALLSHSGSRGAGAAVAAHYSKLAQQQHPDLPKDLSRLAWLDLDSAGGREYWQAMELMGRYAAGNHACIHRHVAAHLGARVLFDLENHHNFAWKEEHGGKEVIVHRKGATPAGAGVLGIIPGSMAAPGYVVRGRGNADSLHSASHGAGRVMSRTKALSTFTWEEASRLLAERDVTLLSAGLDEVPMVYKNIEEVMKAQADLVDILARFDPRIVKMAPAGEKAED